MLVVYWFQNMPWNPGKSGFMAAKRLGPKVAKGMGVKAVQAAYAKMATNQSLINKIRPLEVKLVCNDDPPDNEARIRFSWEQKRLFKADLKLGGEKYLKDLAKLERSDKLDSLLDPALELFSISWTRCPRDAQFTI